MGKELNQFWSLSIGEVLNLLKTSPSGLDNEEARNRLKQYGYNRLKPKRRTDNLTLLLSQFKSPIIIILIVAALMSLFLRDNTNTIIILIIVFISGLLGFWQERGAKNAIAKLLAIVQIQTAVLRSGQTLEIPLEEIVPGDIVLLKAGDIIPADCLLLDSKDLFVDEATLTGESYPVAKDLPPVAANALLNQQTNAIFMGTHVVSGSGTAIVIHTGKRTEFGKISDRLRLKPPETEFERGVQRFGYFLMEVTLLLVIAIFAINVYLSRPILDSFLFSLALAVGLTPQLLPAIISINLSHGARRMAEQNVIVKKLAAIENLGRMNILCSDKTGTLTEGTVKCHSMLDINGNESDKIALFSYLNAAFETSFSDPIDEAIRNFKKIDISEYKKLDEVPYDFNRKRLSILVSEKENNIMVTKGAIPELLTICSLVEVSSELVRNISEYKDSIQKRYKSLSEEGFRILGLAYKKMDSVSEIDRTSESGMIFLGFIVLHDPPKNGIKQTIQSLEGLGISFKMITGDNRFVAIHICRQVGIPGDQILTGNDIDQISDEALIQRVKEVNVFAEVDPNQKERIIISLRKSGNVVGYMGDGINDTPPLHASDVSISVDTAVDVAKEAADFVLMKKDLAVLGEGVKEGRKTFANTLKYVFMATSANFGNMFSMAGASIFLSFLPLLPKQVLLTNLMTDFPEMTISTDNVDAEMVSRPRRWNVKFIRNFMLVFGLLSSIFDFITFFVLLVLLKASPEQFRSGWFMESVISASVIVLVIRTRHLFLKSKPSLYLTIATILVAIVTMVLPFTPLGTLFGFSPLPITFILIMIGIVLVYVATAEFAKRLFYRNIRSQY